MCGLESTKWFLKPSVHTLKIIYSIPSYLSVLQLQNYSWQCNTCAFFRKIEEILFWVIEAISEASATNSIMKLSNAYYVINDEKSLCSALYSSGNIQIESTWGQASIPHSPSRSYINLTKTSVFRWLKKSRFPIIRSTVRHSNAFDRLVRSPRKWIPLSITLLVFSIMPIRHCWVVKIILKPH